MKFFSKPDPYLKRLFSYVFDYKLQLFYAFFTVIGAASMSSLTATLLGYLTDVGFYQREAWAIWAAPLALIGVTLLFAVSTVLNAFLMMKISQSVLVTIRTALFNRMLHWPAHFYQENTSGRISTKFVNEAAMALGGATQALIVLVRDSMQVVALLAVLFWYNWQLTLLTFIVVPLLAGILHVISRRVRRIVKENQDMLGRVVSRVQESYASERLVKVSGTYEFEEERFEYVNRRIRQLTLKTIQMQSLGTPLTQMVTMLAVAIVVGVALIEAQQGLLTIGEFITFLSALLLLATPIQHLAGLNSTMAQISAAAKSIFDTLDSEVENDCGTIDPGRVKGDIRLENVTLRYPGLDKDSLRAINLDIRAGEHVALVGPSGSGKTSFVNLLPRLWEVTSGRITIDGIDTKDMTLEALRRQIAIVSQDVVIFNDTIGKNIAYGLPDATPEEIQAAVDAAALTDFVKSLPKGLDTPAGENGKLLSGGQRQRLSIARAFLKNAPILIMDEATSALDSETENHIKEALARLAQGRTCITVAHRFSTIENADRIAVMQEGQIADCGTWNELMERNATFRTLTSIQMGGDPAALPNVSAAS